MSRISTHRRPRIGSYPRIGLATATVVALGGSLIAAPALADDRGLYGTADATYDGVYRQGLAIVALASRETKVPKRAIKWLRKQQCDNGSFVSYRDDPATDCPASDPVNFSGPDSNSTAMAAMALQAIGDKKRARKARSWLVRSQSDAGGFPYIKGGSPDVNSTGLVLAALYPWKTQLNEELRPARKLIKRAQLPCSAGTDRGLMSYVPEPQSRSSLASAQALMGLVGTLPPERAKIEKKVRTKCESGLQTAKGNSTFDLMKGIKRAIAAENGLRNDFGAGIDTTATVHALTALATARYASGTVKRGMKTLAPSVRDYTGTDTEISPAATALLLTLRTTTKKGVRFGRVDLLDQLQASLR